MFQGSIFPYPACAEKSRIQNRFDGDSPPRLKSLPALYTDYAGIFGAQDTRNSAGF